MSLPVAIVGLSLRYPGFEGPAAFFDSLRRPLARLRRAAPENVRSFLPDHPRGQQHPYRINNDLFGSIREISWIDARKFRVPPSDIEGDPSPFICLQVASEALSDYQQGRTDSCIPRSRTGVVIGRGDHPHRGLWSGLQGGSGFEVIRALLLERPDLFAPSQVDALVDSLLQRMEPFPNPSIAASLVSNVISGMVANRLDLQGPNYLVDAACTSTIVAIQQAVRSLLSGESDLMLVGASQATMSIPIIQMFSMLGAISKTDIQPFNPLMNGTLLSEGVGFVALKRLDDARRDGDKIYAKILGFGLASDGNDSSILAPSSRGQILAMKNTYDSLEDVCPEEIGFLEAHATGINLGDQTELNSVNEVFRPSDRKRPLAIGALKSLIGHSIPASGMAALIRATYAVSYGVLPAARCDHPMDHLLSIQNGMFLPDSVTPWYEPEGEPRRAAINCFGFGGINGHLVIEQEPRESKHPLIQAAGLLSGASSHPLLQGEKLSPSAPDRELISTGCPVQLVCLSFSDEDGLQTVTAQALSALEGLRSPVKTCLYFSAEQDDLETYRIGLVNRDLSQLRLILEELNTHPSQHQSRSKRLPKKRPQLAVMLPGEGLIPFGHLADLARYMPSVKELLDFVNETSSQDTILSDLLHPAWSHLLSEADKRALQEESNHHDVATKILFVVSVAYFGLLRKLGVEPSGLVGHSTGEINALMLSGSLKCGSIADVRAVLSSFDEVYSAGEYLNQISEGTVVLASGIQQSALDVCLDENDDLYLISDNSPSHRLLFSMHRDLSQMSDLLGGYGGFVLPTQLNRPYHTPLFSIGADVMRDVYSGLSLSEVQSNVYSCCSSELYPESPDDQVQLLVRQWTEPVRFRQTLLNMHRDGYKCFLELNASKTLLGFAEATFYDTPDVCLVSTGTPNASEAIDAFANAMVELWRQGVDVRWECWDSLFMFDHDLSLARIERPAHALSIQHDLHHFSGDDLQEVWKNSMAHDVTTADEVTHHSPTPSGSSQELRSATPEELDAVQQHQQTMQMLLDSLNRNTKTVIHRLHNQSEKLP